MTMSGHEFEHHVAKVMRANGYRVTVTRGSGDYGVDLILNGQIAVQVKRYSSPVGPKAVQEVVAGMAIHRCTESWVVTNSTFTAAAIKLAAANGVRLVPGRSFEAMASEVDRPHLAKRAATNNDSPGWSWRGIGALTYVFALLFAANAAVNSSYETAMVPLAALIVFGIFWLIVHFRKKAAKLAKTTQPAVAQPQRKASNNTVAPRPPLQVQTRYLVPGASATLGPQTDAVKTQGDIEPPRRPSQQVGLQIQEKYLYQRKPPRRAD